MGLLGTLAIPYLLIAACFVLMTYREQMRPQDSWDIEAPADDAPARPLLWRGLSLLLCLAWPLAVVGMIVAIMLSRAAPARRMVPTNRTPVSAS